MQGKMLGQKKIDRVEQGTRQGYNYSAGNFNGHNDNHLDFW